MQTQIQRLFGLKSNVGFAQIRRLLAKFRRRKILRIVVLFVCFFVLVRLASLGGPLSGTSFSRAVYDTNGILLRLTLSEDDKYRKFTPIDEISSSLKDAILLREDRFFYYHPGVNPVSLVKASVGFFAGNVERGASTVTMQLVRLLYRFDTRTPLGKLGQILCALYLEFRYSKNDIFEAYLNLLPLGYNIEGAEAASLIYFGKNASKLNPIESITLCVIIPRPSARTRNTDAGRLELNKFRDSLYELWKKNHPNEQDLITLAPHASLPDGKVNLPFLAPHFTEFALKRSEEEIIKTTIDYKFQRILERSITNYIKGKSNQGVKNASALLIERESSEILAYVGSADFFDAKIFGQVDGTRAHRSPGSALKPFLYALAADQGIIHSKTILYDTPKDFSTYSPENFEGDFAGPIYAERALVLSRNIPAMRIGNQLKNPDFYEFLKSMNMRLPHSKEYYGLAPILGGTEVTMQELASLYAALAQDGIRKSISFSRSSHESHETTTLLTKPQSLFSSQASFMTLQMLKAQERSDSIPSDWTNRNLQVYWKTGTSASFKDAWTAGIFGPYVLVVWVGNFDGTSNPAFVGREVAAPLFFQMVEGITSHKHVTQNELSPPDGIEEVGVCAVSGQIPTKHCVARTNAWFIPGRSPIATCQVHREILVDMQTGLRSCGLSQNVQPMVFEFWPSDVERLFRRAGVPRVTPPPFDPKCETRDVSSRPPEITSPLEMVTYDIQQETQIPFKAISDGPAKKLFWFVGDSYVGSAEVGQTFFWRASRGHYVVRVVDDLGGSNSVQLHVGAGN